VHGSGEVAKTTRTVAELENGSLLTSCQSSLEYWPHGGHSNGLVHRHEAVTLRPNLNFPNRLLSTSTGLIEPQKVMVKNTNHGTE
jgi:hypothetical protein